MCGIAGFFFNGRASKLDLQPTINRMTQAIAHRGPDDAQHWIDDEAGVALGHRRLSILDLSPAGRQPMESADGRYVLVYNGEIYNHRDLRAELVSAGAAPDWRGHSDTEVLLAGISFWGLEETLRRSNGMFALALWDRKERALTLARDRFGEKPLYYGWVEGGFVFGSELKALNAHPHVRRELDRDALCLFLRHNYVPTPHSIWKNISKLPQAHYLTLSGSGSRILKCYWSFEGAALRGQSSARADTPAMLDELESLLKDAVLRRMDSDVPTGAFLSGGIDSSLIVALMQAQSASPVKTFSMGFHEKAYNEAEHGKAVARHLGTDHTELYVQPRDALDVVPQLPHIWDEPFADSSQIPTLLLSKLTKAHVTVSLSGDAGDEIFGGYNRYFQAVWLRRNIGKLPSGLRRMLARAMQSPQLGTVLGAVNTLLPARVRQAAVADRLPKLASLLEADTDDALYRQLVSHWSQPEQLVIGGREPGTLIASAPFPQLDFAHRMMAMDTLTYLPDDILVKVDRASMAVSLEARVPFLDHRVAEFAWQMQLDAKINGNTGKLPLRRLLYRHVPQSIVDRPKMGFGVPVEAWLKGPLKHWAEDLLDPRRIKAQGIFEPDIITRYWQEHQQGRRRWHNHLWDVLMFQAWWDAQYSAS